MTGLVREIVEQCIHGRGLTARGRPRDEDHPIELGGPTLETLSILVLEPQVRKASFDPVEIENPDRNLGTTHARNQGNTEVDGLSSQVPFLAHPNGMKDCPRIDPGIRLDLVHQVFPLVPRQSPPNPKNPVDSESHAVGFCKRIDVNIRGPCRNGFEEEPFFCGLI